jgi:hypothetical protein
MTIESSNQPQLVEETLEFVNGQAGLPDDGTECTAVKF